MPIYCYKCEKCGAETDEFVASMKLGWRAHCPVCQKLMERDLCREVGGRPRGESVNAWSGTHASDAIGCHPSEREAYQAAIRKHPGCANVDVNPLGQVETHSHAEQKAVLKGIGMYDFDAYR